MGGIEKRAGPLSSFLSSPKNHQATGPWIKGQE
jgi:hypothetical protein